MFIFSQVVLMEQFYENLLLLSINRVSIDSSRRHASVFLSRRYVNVAAMSFTWIAMERNYLYTSVIFI